MKRSLLGSGLLSFVCVAALSSAGCYVESAPPPAVAPAEAPATQSAVVYTEPPAAPPPQQEVQPASPGPEFEWVAGYHRWNGRSYDWVGGRYERRPHANARHVPAHWEERGRGKVWVEAHWQ